MTTRTWQRAELAVRGRCGAGAVAAGALPVWLASRLAVALTSVAAARLVGGQAADQLALARATRWHPQIRWAYCWVCAPLMLVFVVAVTGGFWMD